jgi:heme/copper-type cytochrome/quinol oxidase subunit 2
VNKVGEIKQGERNNAMKYDSKFLILFTFAFLSTAYLAFGAHKESQPVVAQPSEDGVQRLDVIVDSYSFDPNHIIVTVDKPVELTLKSVTKIVPHDFTLKYPEAGLDVDQSISPGKEVKVTFTPTKAGTYEFYCDKKGLFGSHRKKGMYGTLEVRR